MWVHKHTPACIRTNQTRTYRYSQTYLSGHTHKRMCVHTHTYTHTYWGCDIIKLFMLRVIEMFIMTSYVMTQSMFSFTTLIYAYNEFNH